CLIERCVLMSQIPSPSSQTLGEIEIIKSDNTGEAESIAGHVLQSSCLSFQGNRK
ncbi:Hypothetical predicted protein, partial [Podarcis lilfordi]